MAKNNDILVYRQSATLMVI